MDILDHMEDHGARASLNICPHVELASCSNHVFAFLDDDYMLTRLFLFEVAEIIFANISFSKLGV